MFIFVYSQWIFGLVLFEPSKVRIGDFTTNHSSTDMSDIPSWQII